MGIDHDIRPLFLTLLNEELNDKQSMKCTYIKMFLQCAER
jgi:hypothetical protein